MDVARKVVLYCAVSGHCSESASESCSSLNAAAMHCSSFGVDLLMLSCKHMLCSSVVLWYPVAGIEVETLLCHLKSSHALAGIGL